MLIAHEAPLSIFNMVQQFTDFDYALVHLFEESEVYYKHFTNALKMGREVILDNSIFELGAAFNSEKYCYWISKLKPTWYIIPDVLEDLVGTKNKFDEWNEIYAGRVPEECKKIAVVQGKSYAEIVECYKYIEPHVDKVAISFDYSFFIKEFDELHPGNDKSKAYKLMVGRQNLITQLVADGIINLNKPHHLLGCALPQEFVYYRNTGYEFIESVDTSNPIVHGLNGVLYDIQGGLQDKISTKLIEYMHHEVTREDVCNIMYNLTLFATYCNND